MALRLIRSPAMELCACAGLRLGRGELPSSRVEGGVQFSTAAALPPISDCRRSSRIGMIRAGGSTRLQLARRARTWSRPRGSSSGSAGEVGNLWIRLGEGCQVVATGSVTPIMDRAWRGHPRQSLCVRRARQTSALSALESCTRTVTVRQSTRTHAAPSAARAPRGSDSCGSCTSQAAVRGASADSTSRACTR